MKHIICCSQKECEFEIESPELDIEDISEAISDIFTDWFETELQKEGDIPCGFFPAPAEISSRVYEDIRQRMHQKFSTISVYSKSFTDDGHISRSEQLDIVSVIDRLIEEREESEQCYCDVGAVIIRMLKTFLNDGIWQFGLYSQGEKVLLEPSEWPESKTFGSSTIWLHSEKEFSPIIWFGLEGKAPIECWSISMDAKMFELLDYLETPYSSQRHYIERWKAFWFCSFWCFDWNALFNDSGDCYITWMFAECEMNEPEDEFDRVLKSCPIELDSTDTNEALRRKIVALFQNRNLGGIAKKS